MMKTFLLLALIVSVQPNPIQLPLGGAPEFGFFDLIQDLCSSMSSAGHFNFEELMYDRMTETWTRNCSSVDSCAHGVSIEDDDVTTDVCPSCYAAVGEQCGKWKRHCAANLTCQTATPYDHVGVCVPDRTMTSRQYGEVCGGHAGSCDATLRCQHEADPMARWGSQQVSGHGRCVTEEQFKSRGEGQTCGEDIGECKEDLACVDAGSFFSQKFCQNSTASSVGLSHDLVIEVDGPGFHWNGEAHNDAELKEEMDHLKDFEKKLISDGEGADDEADESEDQEEDSERGDSVDDKVSEGDDSEDEEVADDVEVAEDAEISDVVDEDADEDADADADEDADEDAAVSEEDVEDDCDDAAAQIPEDFTMMVGTGGLNFEKGLGNLLEGIIAGNL